MENSNSEGMVILIVDDDKLLREAGATLCKSLGYEVSEAGDGEVALAIARNDKPDLILMDVMMPVMNGFEATEKLKADPRCANIPIIMLSALDNMEDRVEGIRRGADDYLIKPFNKEELSLRIRNNIKIKKYNDWLKDEKKALENIVTERTKELKASYVDTIVRLNLAAEYKDKGTGNHIIRIGLFSKVIAEEMGLSCEFVENLFYAAPMHDIGKVAVPDAILTKKGALTEEEFEVIKTHTEVGARILSGGRSPIIKTAEEVAFTHHEKWNGKGYPRGLKGEEIPLSGRIVQIVDHYDALRSQRPYKEAISHEKVLEIICNGDERTSREDFDPAVVEAFLSSEAKIRELYDSQRGSVISIKGGYA